MHLYFEDRWLIYENQNSETKNRGLSVGIKIKKFKFPSVLLTQNNFWKTFFRGFVFPGDHFSAYRSFVSPNVLNFRFSFRRLVICPRLYHAVDCIGGDCLWADSTFSRTRTKYIYVHFEPTALLAERVQNISMYTVYIDMFCTRSAKSAVGSKAVTLYRYRVHLAENKTYLVF